MTISLQSSTSKNNFYSFVELNSQETYSNSNLNLFGNANSNTNTFTNTNSNTNSNSNSNTNTLQEKEMLQLESSLEEMFLKQLKKQTKTRYTIGGKKCQDTFISNGKTYSDCTTDRAPDGVKYIKPWCYIEITQRKKLHWSFCKPVMDYDMVREANQKELLEIAVEARKVKDEVEKSLKPAEESLKTLNKVVAGQANLDTKINLLIKQINSTKDQLKALNARKAMWEVEEANIIKLAQDIEKLKKEEAHKKKLKGNKVVYYTEKDEVEARKENHREVFSMIFQKRVKDDNKNCDNMFLYEDEPQGDGIIGKYYDNEFLLGKYIERKDDEIDFEWKGFTPHSNINFNNFSIKWEGYIQAPTTEDYIFTINCDDGAALTLNNKLLIAHNLHSIADESVKRTEQWLDNAIQNTKKGANHPEERYTVKSKPIRLVGGSRFKIVLTYFKSVHNSLADRNESFINLKWSTAEMEEAIISKQYLFSKNLPKPLKITNYDSDLMVKKMVYENDLYFKDSDSYIMQDIPTQFLGSKCLKFPIKYSKDKIKFTINTAQMVYLAVLSHYPNPLPEEFLKSEFKMSILEFDHTQLKRQKKSSKKVTAEKSGVLVFYEKFFPPGLVEIPLKLTGANSSGVPGLFLIFRVNNFFGGAYPDSCGGHEEHISNPTSKYYKGCTESSVSNGNRCEFGLNGKMKDKYRQIWSSKAEGIGAWIKVVFKGLFYLTRFEFKNRSNISERNSKIQLEFSSGEKREFNLKNDDELENFELGNIKTEYVIFTIIGVYGTVNNGGSFNVFGVKCSSLVDFEHNEIEATGIKKLGLSLKEFKPIFHLTHKNTITIDCKETLQSTKKFDHLKLNKKGHVLIKCLDSCKESKVNIFGNGIYSKNSGICKAAFHSEKISATGGFVNMFFEKGRKQYTGALRNGVNSLGRGKSDFSFSFTVYEEEEDIIVKQNSKIDLLSDNGVDWLPAIITKVEPNPDGRKLLTLSIENDSSKENIKKIYPNLKMIHPCGDHLHNRSCHSSRRGINKYKPFKVRFAPKNYKSSSKDSDYYFDNGEIFGSSGRPYGWSRVMRHRIVTSKDFSSPLLETHIKFPPTINSKYCTEPNAETMCESVDWSVKVGDGMFIVEIFVGDADKKAKIDIKVNGEFLAQNEQIPKNKLKSFKKTIEAHNKFLIFTTECEKDCDFSLAVINAIEITPIVDKGSPLDDLKKGSFSLSSEEELCGSRRTTAECENASDILHCVYSSFTESLVTKCTGNNVVMEVPESYKCKDQRKKFKCVRRAYSTNEECFKNCVKPCKGNRCVY